MTRLAGLPAYCASCFQHDTEARHVDFEAAYDGPVIPGTPEPIPVDDLVICERCLTEAFAILDPEGLKAHIKALEAHITELERDRRSKDRLIQNLRVASEELAEQTLHRPGGRPGFEGLPKATADALSKTRPKPKSSLQIQREKRLKRERQKAAAAAAQGD